MQPERPLLTIAIPTYNRSRYLAELLTVLAPQLRNHPEIELFISDNASPDDTQQVVERFRTEGMECRYLRNEENIGSDPNFLQCFQEARGRYFWMVGDDDILVPGSVEKIAALLSGADYDVVFARPYGFRERYDEVVIRDPLGRSAIAIEDGGLFTSFTGTMLTFISAVIVNRERFFAIGAPDPARLVGTNLIQFGWVLPLLQSFRRGLIVYGGQVAGREANSGGYSLSGVFGRNLRQITSALLGNDSDLAACIVNKTLRTWFPGVVVQWRKSEGGSFGSQKFHELLKPIFGSNIRYWIFVFPAIKAPLGIANALVQVNNTFISRLDSAFLAIRAMVSPRCHPVRA